jgi:hypothetical protein
MCPAGTATLADSAEDPSTQRPFSVDPGPPVQGRYTGTVPDFAALAGSDERLRPYVRIRADGRGTIDFSDYNACRWV